MYQIIGVDDHKAVDWLEVIRAMPADGKSKIILDEPSPACAVEWAEPISERRN